MSKNKNDESIREVFSYYQRQKDGSIPVEYVEEAFRGCGKNPSLKDIEIIKPSYQKLKLVDFKKFLAIIHEINELEGELDSTTAFEEFIRCMSLFDHTKTGTVTLYQFKNLLKSLGERLGEKEELAVIEPELLKFKESKTSDEFNYENFLRHIIDESVLGEPPLQR
ncbi:unnamed protein product [Gordionus sp. m RMFG-2023]